MNLAVIKRMIEERALFFSKKYPVLTITGPRQSGKTTLVQSVFPEHLYFTLENPQTRTLVLNDPNGFLYPIKIKN